MKNDLLTVSPYFQMLAQWSTIWIITAGFLGLISSVKPKKRLVIAVHVLNISVIVTTLVQWSLGLSGHIFYITWFMHVSEITSEVSPNKTLG